MTKKKVAKKKAVDDGVDVNVDFDFEDAKPQTFIFQLPDHYAGKRVYGQHVADKNSQIRVVGTRDEVKSMGKNLTRYYGAEVRVE